VRNGWAIKAGRGAVGVIRRGAQQEDVDQMEQESVRGSGPLLQLSACCGGVLGAIPARAQSSRSRYSAPLGLVPETRTRDRHGYGELRSGLRGVRTNGR